MARGMMNELVWVSGAMMNERLVLRITADIIVNDKSRAVEGLRRMNAGERLSEDWFPRQIWVDKNGAAKNPLPDLFYGNSY